MCVSTGEEAIRRARQLQPDLILMDMRLPGIDGIEATRRLHDDPATAGVPVAVCSGQAFDEDVRRAREAGCVDYLAKPLAARELLDRVSAILASRGRSGRIARKPRESGRRGASV
jgi:CheY-like chemotaxis protein